MGMPAEWVMIGEPIARNSTTSYRRSMGECLVVRGTTSGMRTGVNGKISWTRADGPPQSLDIWRFMCTMNGQSGNRNRRLRLQLKLKYQPTADQIDAVYRVPLHPETALPSI
ncbi:GM22409 [Drosophila sechellia]|uniref:GM22409 n=1 Tax=Drosophila sechellia TaxID=7238 RepID=B4IAW1_DROSE|nr:GM22409 [Drosophila sechellia]